MITIALADHHHLIREGVRSLLETEKDFKVIGESCRRPEGRRPRRALHNRVLIMALAMHGLDSLEVTRRIRRRSPETAVILLSMWAGHKDPYDALTGREREVY